MNRPPLLIRSFDRMNYALREYGYSLGAAVRSCVSELGLSRDPGASIERAISDFLVATQPGNNGFLPRGEILVPIQALARAASQVSTGTGEHLSPRALAWSSFLTPASAVMAAGPLVLENVTGSSVKIASSSDLDAAQAQTLAEVASLDESEAPTLEGPVAHCKSLRTSLLVSNTLLANLSPATEAALYQILQAALVAELERQVFVGTGTGLNTDDELPGIFPNIPEYSPAVTSTNEAGFLALLKQCRDSGAASKPSLITTQEVIDDGMQREQATILRPVIEAVGDSEYRMLGTPVRRTQGLPIGLNGGSPDLPRIHSAVAACWREAYALAFFGAGVTLQVDPYSLASSHRTRIYARMHVGAAITQSAAIAYTSSIDLS